MIEKMAKAMAARRRELITKPLADIWGDIAEAALTALEEPTREMSFAWSDAMLEEDPESDLSSYDAEAIFVAMIRAAKETTHE